MQSASINDKRHRFPPQVIAHAVWLYVRFNLSLREVEEMLLERGIEVSDETIRRWLVKFGPGIARTLRRQQGRTSQGRIPHALRQFAEMVALKAVHALASKR